ncbi:protein REGULATOR OF FATTY ACID COMPOSITION 3, chloroplastic [Syzygium oleosum]|uniref:protein REGULATOR OF FATTY ACID COMPOSITION 3, chloroplastic n=1 Tax=Syzygium oleosum TaxID=219896 RepID=UPI0011D1BDF5|nr:protein REGULATOR OF FATTY ACID COMPOSITION 3, chloroplastic [Syzygium oleosum]
MEFALQSSSSSCSSSQLSSTIPKFVIPDRFSWKRSHCPAFLNVSSSSSSPSSWSLCSINCLPVGTRKSVTVGAKKRDKDGKKGSDGYLFGPDESTGLFPEAVLLKEKKVQEDGKLIPEFADAEEKELFEYLNLQMESNLKVTEMRHYEVVYLIHEKHVEEVGSVNQKVEDFLQEKKGKVWRFENWGLRRLAYKIRKAKYAHYILMNFELEGKWINDFKTMLDKDERVIRHLVMKRDKAITEVLPPPPEFHKLRGGIDDGEDEMDDFEDEEEDEEEESWDVEDEMDDYGDEEEDGIIMVNSDEDEGETKSSESPSPVKKGKSRSRAEKVLR